MNGQFTVAGSASAATPAPDRDRETDGRPQKVRLPSLDGWRAVAILLVLISHWPSSGGGYFLLEAHPNFFGQGDFGVRIFFVISGFLITFLLISEQEKTGGVSLRRFYIRRALRILPVYFLYVFVLLVLQVLGHYQDTLSSWIGVFTFTRNVVGVGNSATAHFWSLAVEEQFYVIFPLLAVALSLLLRPRIAIAVLMTAVTASILLSFFGCDAENFLCTRVLGKWSIIAYASSLAVGCMFAFTYHFKLSQLPNSSAAFWASAFILIALRTGMVDLGPASFLQNTVEAILIGVCITHTILQRPWLVYEALNSPPMIFLGLISYSLYVWHFIYLVNFTGFKVHSPLFDWRLWWIPALLTAISSYLLVERPINSLRLRYRAF